MKKFIVVLGLVGFFSTLFANTEAHLKRIEDMNKMMEGLEFIQKGFLMNCPDCMFVGVDQVKSGLTTLESVEAKEYLPEEQQYAFKFAQKTAKKIEMELDYMVESFKAGKLSDAGDAYKNVGMECLSCHMRIRDWGTKQHKNLKVKK